MRTLQFMALVVGFGMMTSCAIDQSTPEEDKPVEVRVYDEYLYKEELKEVGVGHPKADSLEMVENFVKNWATRVMLRKEAEKHLDKGHEDIEKEIEDYRTSLLIYAYEKELIQRELDTTVKQKHIEKYYTDYQDNFELYEDIYNLYYVKVHEESPVLKELGKMMQRLKEEEREELLEMCEKHATEYALSDTRWLTTKEVLTLLPLDMNTLVSVAEANYGYKTKVDDHFYLIQIRELRQKGSPAPIEYVEDDIVKIIINKRKASLLDRTNKKIFQREANSKNFQRY